MAQEKYKSFQHFKEFVKVNHLFNQFQSDFTCMVGVTFWLKNVKATKINIGCVLLHSTVYFWSSYSPDSKLFFIYWPQRQRYSPMGWPERQRWLLDIRYGLQLSKCNGSANTQVSFWQYLHRKLDSHKSIVQRFQFLF